MILIQSDNGTILEFTVKDSIGVVDLTSSTITVKLNNGTTTISKSGVITNAIQGKFTCTLSSTDLAVAGDYNYQTIVKFTAGPEFASEIQMLTVRARMA